MACVPNYALRSVWANARWGSNRADVFDWEAGRLAGAEFFEDMDGEVDCGGEGSEGKGEEGYHYRAVHVWNGVFGGVVGEGNEAALGDGAKDGGKVGKEHEFPIEILKPGKGVQEV